MKYNGGGDKPKKGNDQKPKTGSKSTMSNTYSMAKAISSKLIIGRKPKK